MNKIFKYRISLALVLITFINPIYSEERVDGIENAEFANHMSTLSNSRIVKDTFHSVIKTSVEIGEVVGQLFALPIYAINDQVQIYKSKKADKESWKTLNLQTRNFRDEIRNTIQEKFNNGGSYINFCGYHHLKTLAKALDSLGYTQKIYKNKYIVADNRFSISKHFLPSNYFFFTMSENPKSPMNLVSSVYDPYGPFYSFSKTNNCDIGKGELYFQLPIKKKTIRNPNILSKIKKSILNNNFGYFPY